MFKSSRIARLPEARALFASGKNCEAVARIVGVHVGTIYRWKDREGKRGLDWNALRGSTPDTSPRALVIGLEQLLGAVLADASLAPAAKAHALAEVHGIIDSERAYQAEAAGVGRFASWAARELPPGEGRAVVNAVVRYGEELRSGAAQPVHGSGNHV